MKKKIQAFTLLEALVIMAIVSVLLAVGVPGLRSLTTNTGLTSYNNELVTVLQFARSASIRLQDRVVVCTSDNATTPTPSCGDITVPWSSGWLVFHDINNDSKYVEADGDELFRVRDELSIEGVTIDIVGTGANIENYVSYAAPAGEPMKTDGTNQSGIFRICLTDDSAAAGSRHIRGVILNVSGRVASTRDTTVIGSTCP